MPKSYIRIFISLIGALKVCFGAKKTRRRKKTKNIILSPTVFHDQLFNALENNTIK